MSNPEVNSIRQALAAAQAELGMRVAETESTAAATIAPPVPETPPQAKNIVGAAPSQDLLPVQVLSRRAVVPHAEASAAAAWWKSRGFRNVAAAAVLSMVFVGGFERFNGNDGQTSTAGTERIGQHHDATHHRHKHKAHAPAKTPTAPVPTVTVSPHVHPKQTTPYVLKDQNTPATTPTEAPTPTAPTSPASSPTTKPSEAASGGSSFKIATYNQKNHLPDAKHHAAVRLILRHHFDIVGTQETGWNKYHDYRQLLAEHDYGMFPKHPYKGSDQLCSRNAAIIYNKARFKLIGHHFVSFPQYPEPAVKHCSPGESATAGHANAPVVELEDVKTGQEFFVMNTHNVANVKEAAGHNPSRRRYLADRVYVEEIRQLNKENPGIPIFLTGDFNEGTGVRTTGNTTYHGDAHNLLSQMFKRNGLLDDAACRNKPCHHSGKGSVDYIYHSPGVRVDWFRTIGTGGPKSEAPSYSDHPIKYANFHVPSNFDVMQKRAHHRKRVTRR